MGALLINIDVSDLKRASGFYCEAFDLRMGRRLGEDIVELLGFPAPLFLLEKKEGSLPFENAPAPRTFKRHWTPLHLDIIVDSIDLAVEKVKAAGGTLESDIERAPWGQIAQFADPFGNGLCLIQFTGRGYDELDGRAGCPVPARREGRR